MKRKKSSYARPKRLYESTRIKEENSLKKKYGLKNKTEIWKAIAKIRYYRKRAMDLAAEGNREKQEAFFEKLKVLGFPITSSSDVLGLNVENVLKRRLPTLVAEKKFANTVKHARQLVVHKKVLINGRVVNSPSYIVPTAYESQISIRQKAKQEKTSETISESSGEGNA